MLTIYGRTGIANNRNESMVILLFKFNNIIAGG